MRVCLLMVLSISAMLGAGVAAVPRMRSSNVRQLNGRTPARSLRASFQIVTESWRRVVAVPYIVYMPDKDRVLMLASCDYPHQAVVLRSDDRGSTWSAPRFVHLDAQGKPDVGMGTGLTYLGGGKVCFTAGDRRWISRDHGETWSDSLPIPPASNGKPWYEWDPLLVDRDTRSGKILRLMSYCSDNLQPDGHFQGYVRFSSDEGASWTGEIKVPELYRVNEVAFVRARNRDIIAACRTDNPDRYRAENDHFGGLGIVISNDDGRTWSKLAWLFEWGRHHPSMVLLPNGDIVMTYVVRRGYTDTPDGFLRFGIEAVVSHENGRTWDLDHRYILASWPSTIKGPNAWYPSSQATSSVLLPDGSILTAFGTGYRCNNPPDGKPIPRDVGLVRWRVNNRGLNHDRTIRDAPFDSDTRNVFDPGAGDFH